MRIIDAQKKNFLLYFSVYFIAQLMYIYINAYLPIYFTYASGINLPELGLILFASFSFMFVKPLLSIYFDWSSRKDGKQSPIFNKKILLIFGASGAIVSFIILLFSLELLFVFMVFLGSNIAFISLMDVIIDKIILINSTDEIMKNKNAFFLQFGSVFGAIIPNIYYFIFMDDRTKMAPWSLFFIAGIITVIITFPVLFILKENGIKKDDSNKTVLPSKPININNLLLMSVFIFLTYGTFIYDWVLEPWAVGKLGSDSLFALILIVFIILDVISLIFAMKNASKFDKKKLLLIVVLISGSLTIIASLSGIYIFIILYVIIQLLSGFFIISMTTMMFDISHKKVFAFQIMAMFAIVAKVILAPIGLNLSVFLSGEFIIMIAGILQILAVIPLFFIK